MRRISIDTLRFISPKGGSTFRMAKRRTPWYLSRPRLLATLLLFGVLWLWLNYGGHEISIPEDSFTYLEDESLRDILNSTLGFQKILVLNLPFRTDRRDAMILSAASSNMQLEFVDGVTGDSIKEKAYPPPEENIKLSDGIRGSWRTHMNALQRVVEQNLTTALIFEDDVDWDIRVRQNLQRFALASRFLSENKEVLSSSPGYTVEYRKNTETPYTAFHILNNKNITDHLLTLPLSSVYKARTSYSRHRSSEHASPYGDPEEWDVLWIGHCGSGFPRYESTHRKAEATTANIVLRHENDATVPKGKYLKAHPFQDTLDPLASAYPEHTRIFHRATGGTLCTVGYAVSQRGARRLLHQFGVKAWNGILDAEFGRWCADEDPQPQYPSSAKTPPKDQIPIGGVKYKRKGMDRVCLTSQPPIFAHHHPKNGQSDIGGLGGGYAKKYETKYLRYSIRMNLERLMQKATPSELDDQWPD